MSEKNESVFLVLDEKGSIVNQINDNTPNGLFSLFLEMMSNETGKQYYLVMCTPDEEYDEDDGPPVLAIANTDHNKDLLSRI